MLCMNSKVRSGRTNKKLEKVNYILAIAEGVSQKEYDELSEEVANLDNININVEYVMDRMVKLSAANTKLANLLDKMHDRVIELEKSRPKNESLYSNG